MIFAGGIAPLGVASKSAKDTKANEAATANRYEAISFTRWLAIRSLAATIMAGGAWRVRTASTI
jgi:hypothetical protein